MTDTCTLRIGLLLLLAGAGGAAAAQTETETHVRTFLTNSDVALADVQASGVYGQYAQVLLKLAQGRVYAKLGDPARTLQKLPLKTVERQAWLSGGDGMVRQYVVSMALVEIHQSMLQTLAGAGRLTEALDYIQQLSPAQGAAFLYYELGFNLKQPGKLPAALAQLGAPSRQQVLAGKLLTLATTDQMAAARKVYKRLQAETRTIILSELVQLLAIDSRWQDLAQLLAVKGVSKNLTADTARYVLSLVMQGGDSDAAAILMSRLGPIGDSAMHARMALVLSDQDISHAKRLFKQKAKPGEQAWETLAIRLDEDAWLETHYQLIKDPWRRSERFFQFAKRRLATGHRLLASKLAAQSRQAAVDIPSAGTRALAFQLLAEYYAEAADVASAKQMLEEIGNSAANKRAYNRAMVAVARAQAASGNLTLAEQRVAGITESEPRLDGLLAVAAVSRSSNSTAYERLIQQAREQVQGWDGKREAAWSTIVKTQQQLGDSEGISKTLVEASNTGAHGQALRFVVEAHIQQGNFDVAFTLVKQFASSTEDQDLGSDLLSETIKGLANAGSGASALARLEQVTHAQRRDLAAPLVVKALIEGGHLEAAVALTQTIKRGDARHSALVHLMRQWSARGELPPRSLMALIPNRQGAQLCWAVTASVDEPAKVVDAWIAHIESPICRAFAYTGSAQAMLAQGSSSRVDEIYAFTDPGWMETLMLRVMLRMQLLSP